MCCTKPDRTPSLSILMGVYNIANLPTFPLAIDSILKQTYSDFEFILCDDGSEDQTWECLCKLATRDSRVRLLRNPCNLGLAATLNHCIMEARAPVLGRHDADDYSAPDRFARQMEFLRCHTDIAFVGSDVALFDQRGVYGLRCFPQYPQPSDFLFTMPFVHGALFFRKECLLHAGLYRISKETRRTEDYDLLMRMYALGFRGANINQPLYFFLEDQAAGKRRKYRYRIDEVKVRWKGFSDLDLLPQAFPYVVKPLLVGLLPARLLAKIKWHYRERKNQN